jgi:aspartyl-tRNA(Asn)/glutamyl-tRNA(Gln) amidotransferase subunit A
MNPGLDPMTLTISSALEGLRKKLISPLELSEAFLHRIDELNPSLNAFITRLDDFMRSDGVQLLAKGEFGLPLYGIPLAVKDLYEIRGTRTTAGSHFFRDYQAEEDSAVIRKLKESGALILGKTNTHEFAFGVTGVNPHYGTCHNPWDIHRISGGSSSGSAVAVATGMALGALGTDTGGSIRIPASLCGVVGLKPTYGRVSLRGVFPLSWNLDHAGPLTKTVRDSALMLQSMAGYDPLDPSSVDKPLDDYLLQIDKGVKGWRIAIATGAYIQEANAEVVAAVDEAGRIFRDLGADVISVDMDNLRELALSNGQMVAADAAALHRERFKEHPDWFGADVRERLEIGRALSSTEYSLARRKQSEGQRWMENFFKEYDLLILPTTPVTAPLIEGTDAIEQARRLTRFTAPFNLTGLPALSTPCGLDSKGLPIGLQLVSGAWKEASVLRAGQAFEDATDWHRKSPPLNLRNLSASS